MGERWHIVNSRKVAIHWSDEDNGYIATVPSLPGCSAIGFSTPSAAREISFAMQAWLSACQAAGNPIPPRDWQPPVGLWAKLSVEQQRKVLEWKGDI